MNERFLVRTEGGPCDGETRVADGWEWPLPDVLKYDATGNYVKDSESQLGQMEADSRVLRGATYRWEKAP